MQILIFCLEYKMRFEYILQILKLKYFELLYNITMKHTVNFPDYFNSCLKREQSLKSTSHLKMGLTVSAFHANTKTNKKHCRTKTDQLCQPQNTMSSTSIFQQAKLKTQDNQKRQRKKTSSELELKKINSYKTFDSTHQFKSSSTYKSTNAPRQHRSQTQIIRSIQKLRKDILNKSNPQLVQQQLKNLQHTTHDKKSTTATSSLANQYHLLSNDLLDIIKKMQKKHCAQISNQKQTYERKQQKLVNKIIEVQKKNQHCMTLINQLRINNVDVDSIWHQKKCKQKTSQLVNHKIS